MPNVVHSPSMGDGVFVLRAPAPPASKNGVYLPPIHTEEDLRQGCEEAERSGRAAAAAELEALRVELQAAGRAEAQRLLSSARALTAERQRILVEASEGVVELAFRIARVVIRSEVESREAVVVPLVRELLQRSAAAGNLTVRLSPRDHAALSKLLGAIPELVGVEGLRLRLDPHLGDGGCVVETEAGALDGTIETQLQRIEAALRKREPEFHEEPRRAPEPEERRP